MTTRAQTESVGVVLLTAVIVLTVGGAGAVVLADVNTGETTRADLSVTVTDEGVGVTHDGGQPVAFSDLQVVIRQGNETWRPSMNASGVATGDGDEQFEPGERWTTSPPLDTGSVATVQVVERQSNTVLADGRRYPTADSPLTPTS